MVVLSEERPGEDFPPERIVRRPGASSSSSYGMPIDWRPVEASASLPACRAVVATRLHAPDREAALLRRLRVLQLLRARHRRPGGHRARRERGADRARARCARGSPTPRSSPRCEADRRASRSPSPASRAQDYKLGGPAEERRYTCPSYELIRVTEPPVDWPTASRVDLPGYRPVEAYETAIANIAPELVRRPDPESVEEVLAWAGMPIATAEVAAVCDREIADVRTELARVGDVPAGRRRRLLDRRRLSAPARSSGRLLASGAACCRCIVSLLLGACCSAPRCSSSPTARARAPPWAPTGSAASAPPRRSGAG